MRHASTLSFLMFAGLAGAGLAGCNRHPSAEHSEAIQVLLSSEPNTADPRHVTDANALKITRLIYGSLVRIDSESLNPVLDLAASVEQPTTTVYRVKLKDHLRFSDGTQLTSADVVATFKGLSDPEVGSRFQAGYEVIDRVHAQDELTVTFHLREPRATFLTDLEFPILPKMQARQPEIITPTKTVGAGAFRVVEWKKGRIKLEANAHYHQARPRHRRIDMVVIRDDNTRVMRMLADAGDLVLNATPPLLLPLLERDPTIRVKRRPGISTTYVGLNLASPPVDDPHFRQALAAAIDVPSLIQAKLEGYGQPATSWIPPGHWAHNPAIKPIRYSPEHARELIRRAGSIGGPLLMRVSTSRASLSLARALAQMWRQVGIEVDVRPTELATLLSDLNKGRFQITLLQIPEVIEPHTLSWFFSAADGPNRWRYARPAADEAFHDALIHTDLRLRQARYRQIQRMLREDLPIIPLWHEDTVAVVDASLPAFVVPRDGRFTPLSY